MVSVVREFETFQNREDWLAARQKGIGASESSIVLGVSKWGTLFELWSKKVGLKVEQEETEPQRWGLVLEKPIALEYERRTERAIEYRDDIRLYHHPEHNFMLATPDATVVCKEHEGPGVLQIKNTNAFAAKDWDDEVPLYYQVQVQHEIACTGYQWGSIAVLIGGQLFKWADIERNDRFIESMIPKLASFWEMVKTEQPPEAGPADAELLAKLYPEHSGESIELPVDAVAWDENLQQWKARQKELERLIEDRENKIKQAIGDAAIGSLPDGTSYSWKKQTRKAHMVKESSFRVLRRRKAK